MKHMNSLSSKKILEKLKNDRESERLWKDRRAIMLLACRFYVEPLSEVLQWTSTMAFVPMPLLLRHSFYITNTGATSTLRNYRRLEIKAV